MQATMLAFRANARYGVPNTEDERLSHAVYLMDSEVTLSQAAAVCMVSERALRTRWNKRRADRRADEVGLLRNEWDSLLPVVRGRPLMIATDEGFRAAAILAHRAAAVDQRGRQVGQRGQWHLEPLVSALGWDPSDIDTVGREVKVFDGTFLDYALKVDSIPRVYLEAKGISENLDERSLCLRP